MSQEQEDTGSHPRCTMKFDGWPWPNHHFSTNFKIFIQFLSHPFSIELRAAHAVFLSCTSSSLHLREIGYSEIQRLVPCHSFVSSMIELEWKMGSPPSLDLTLYKTGSVTSRKSFQGMPEGLFQPFTADHISSENHLLNLFLEEEIEKQILC